VILGVKILKIFGASRRNVHFTFIYLFYVIHILWYTLYKVVYMMFLLCKIDIILNQNIQVDRKSLFNASWMLKLIQNIQFTSNFTHFRVKFIAIFYMKDIFFDTVFSVRVL